MGELIQYLHRAVGDRLRGVATYDGTDHRLLYVREDLRDRLDGVSVGRLVERFRAAELDAETRSDLFGEHGTTLRTYGDTLVLHCVSDGGTGTLVSMDADVGSDFLSFAGECARLSADRHESPSEAGGAVSTSAPSEG